jgi:hypothetical protein
LDEIQGNLVFEETTTNMQDSMAVLDDLHGERRRSMEASVAAKVAQADAEADAKVPASPVPLGVAPCRLPRCLLGLSPRCHRLF